MYNYEKQKEALFTDKGQIMFLKVRDRAKHLLNTAGAFTLENAISGLSGDTWMMMACVDRLVELKEIKEIEYGAVAGQFRIFVNV